MKLKLLSIIAIILLTQSCSKEEYPNVEHKTNYYYLTASQINQTPYFTNKAFDTISYSSNKGDTLTFVKTKSDTTWYCKNGIGNPNTGYDKDCYQTLHNTYATIRGNGSFEVSHSKLGYYYGPQWDFIEINFSDLNFYIYDERIGLKNIPFYLDSISVNSRTYYNSLFVYHEFTYSNIGKAYANKNFGVFQIEDKRSNVIYNLTK